MAKAKDLMNKLGGGGGGSFFPKNAPKPVIPQVEGEEKQAGKPAGKHVDGGPKGHNMKGKGPGAATVPTSVRPKV